MKTACSISCVVNRCFEYKLCSKKNHYFKEKFYEKYNLVIIRSVLICHNNPEVYLTSTHTFLSYPLMSEDNKVGQ